MKQDVLGFSKLLGKTFDSFRIVRQSFQYLHLFLHYFLELLGKIFRNILLLSEDGPTEELVGLYLSQYWAHES
jgi:hypothetical protein